MTRLHSSPAMSLAARLAELPSLPRDQLIELWEEYMGKPPPKAASSPLLVRAIAYAIQEQQLGGFGTPELRVLRRIGRSVGEVARTRETATTRTAGVRSGAVAGNDSTDAPNTQAGPRGRRKPPVSSRPAAPIVLKAGTKLMREWQGKSHMVDVRRDGFGWNGTVYRSLSAVARAITGTHLSGNRFFRL